MKILIHKLNMKNAPSSGGSEVSPGVAFSSSDSANKQTVLVDVHADKDGNLQAPSKNGSVQKEVTDDHDKITIIPDSPVSNNVDGFCHTVAERRNILKGKRNSNIGDPNVQSRKKLIVGRSSKVFNINSANDTLAGKPKNKFRPWTKSTTSRSEGRSSRSSTKLIYVGKLKSNTSTNAMRRHLLDIGVINEDLADVIKLNCKNSNENSFCISLNHDAAVRTVFDADNWPSGVRLRPFNPAAPKKTLYNRPPRHLAMKHTSSAGHDNNVASSYDRPVWYDEKLNGHLDKNEYTSSWFHNHSNSYVDSQRHRWDDNHADTWYYPYRH